MVLVLAVTLAATVALSALAYGLGLLLGDRGEPLRERVRARLGHAPPPVPDGRPIEAIGADLRRLGRRFHTLDPHASFAKVEAVRCAYDRALAECCTALGLTHLLGVLPAGPELDAERERVEEQLAGRGVRFPHAA
jgi:hypothetical protein